MGNEQEIIKIIYNAIDQINEELPKNNRIEKKMDATLFGREGKLDSLGLVNLIVAVEEGISDKYDKFITIANEKAMSLKNSPFRNVQTLSEYILSLEESE